MGASDTSTIIRVQKEIIWHMTCGACSFTGPSRQWTARIRPRAGNGHARYAPQKARLKRQKNSCPAPFGVFLSCLNLCKGLFKQADRPINIHQLVQTKQANAKRHIFFALTNLQWHTGGDLNPLLHEFFA